MSHSIDGGRDEYDDDDFGVERAPRGRRARVIVDDSYGGDFDDAPRQDRIFDDEAGRFAAAGARSGYAADEDDAPRGGLRGQRRGASRAVVARSASRGGRRSRRGGGEEARQTTAGVFFYAMIATVVWVAGVGAFAAGFYQIPVDDPAAAIERVNGLPAQILLMTGAIALAPLGFIWLSAATARRAQRVAREAERLREIVASGGGGAGGGVGGVAEFEESVAAIEARASEALANLERGSAEVAAIARDMEKGADRLAALVADRVAAKMGGAVGAGGAGYEPSPEPRPRPGAAANDAIARAAEAARGAMAGAAPVAPEPDRTTRIDALRRRLEGRGRDESPRDLGPDLGNEPPLDEDFADFDAAPETGGQPEADAPPRAEIDWSKLVRAANFPDSEDDRETLDALYAVLTDPEAAALLQSAEDALSALADIEYYMEDLTPHHAPAELWRAFIVDGDRRDTMDLGGIRDTHAIEDVAAAFEQNPDFGPVAERFMERYEGMLERLFAEAPSAKLAVELADTRSGRAYMLLARSAGRFG